MKPEPELEIVDEYGLTFRLSRIGNMGQHLGKLLAISEFKGELCGQPSDTVVEALKGMDVTYYKSFDAT